MDKLGDVDVRPYVSSDTIVVIFPSRREFGASLKKKGDNLVLSQHGSSGL
jgi:hypothetical protein